MKPQPRYQPGDKIGGRYQVHQALMGGMGEVYLCLDLETIHPFALKTFQQRFMTNPKLIEAFKNEVAAWVALGKHPNIVRCFHLNTLDNLPFMVLEWVVGHGGRSTDLRSWLRHGPLDLRLALDFTVDICRGLIHANEKTPGIIHRDLKPDNVLVSQGRIAKITDFGLAKIAHDGELKSSDAQASEVSAPRLSNQGGTYQYMAPEQWLGHDIDQRTDIYGLGCILYELLTGNWPYFEATTVSELRHHHLNAAIPLLAELHPAGVLNELIVNSLAKRREERFANAEGFLKTLSVLYRQLFAETPKAIPSSDELTATDYANRAATYMELGRHAEALTDANHAINLDSNLSQAYTNRGVIYRRMKRYPEAIADYDRAIDLDPSDAQTYSNRGIVYSELQKYEESLAVFERAIQLDPFDARIFSNRASTYIGIGQNEEALIECGRAIQIDPTCVEAYVNRGDAFDGLQRYEDALADYGRAAQIAPYYAGIFFHRGTTYFALQRYEEALADYNRALHLDSTNAKAFCNRGAVYQALHRFQEALSDYNHAIQLDPTDAVAYRNRGNIHDELGRYDKALADFGWVIQLDRNNASNYILRGLIYVKLQRHDEALTDFKRAVELDSTDATAYFDVGVLFYNTGKWHEALSYFEKAAELGLSQGAQNAREVRQRLAFEAFVAANSYDEMRRAVDEFPLMKGSDFILVVDRVADQMDSSYIPKFDERLAWLSRVASREQYAPQLSRSTSRKRPSFFSRFFKMRR